MYRPLAYVFVFGIHAAKLVPPPRPTARKLSDTSAMLEWPEYQLRRSDLDVTFIKIQYRDTSGSSRTWNTLDEDLDPSTRSYVVHGLKPGWCIPNWLRCLL